MPRNLWILTLAASFALPAVAADPKPVAAAAPAKVADDKDKDTPSKFETRATEAFNRGQYSLAKELFGKAADRIKESDPKKYAQLQEQIKACEKNIKELAAVLPIPPADLNPGPQVETAPDKRKKHVAPPKDQVMEITMQELGNFDYNSDKGGNIPDDVKKLNGVKVRVKGFMIPLDQADNISHFSLVPSLFACCFGQPPQVQHQVVVHTPKGKAVSYYPDEIVCEGTLKVEEKKEDGYIVSVFEMDVSSVKPLAK
ncbi:MAG TPA: DUF3299 domain-containing protein [Tepidisphaeraceae bacterium]|nr:DUF3299 domain-containing protein [Tepidisphaeraceae bacterium]